MNALHPFKNPCRRRPGCLPRRALITLTLSAMLTLCSCATKVRILRQHDLKPAELRGTVAVHSIPIPHGDPAYLAAAEEQVSDALKKAGLTPVAENTRADWYFQWTELSLNNEVVANLRMHGPGGRVRWLGGCSEVGYDDGSLSRTTRRIRLLMEPFPGENQNSDRMGMRLRATSGDVLQVIGTGLSLMSAPGH